MNHTNPALTGEIREVIRTVPKKEWENLFDAFAKEEYEKIGSLDEKGLTNMQSRVSILKELRALFTSIHNTKTKPQ